MTYSEKLSHKQGIQEGFLLFQPYTPDGKQMGWVKLSYSYIETEYTFKRTEIEVYADRPYPWVSDEDIEQSIKDFYYDKTIIDIKIS